MGLFGFILFLIKKEKNGIMNKLLTVVITTYNRNQLLLETLKSFESQWLYDQYKILISKVSSYKFSVYNIRVSCKLIYMSKI